MSEIKGWSADPSGRHQERYFSDGQPTGLVRDVGHESYDSGPSFSPPTSPIGFAPPGANGNGSAAATMPVSAPPLSPPPADYREGWHPDSSGQLRYFANGQPTAWVSDAAGVREEAAPVVLTPPDPQPKPADVDDPLQSVLGHPGPRNDQTARPAGWYRNASDPNDVRYWDGSDWIGQRSDATNGSSVETNGATATATAPAPAAPEHSTDRQGWQHDPFGRYKFRWFSAGEATTFVSDGDGKAFDEADRPTAQGPAGVEAHPNEGQGVGDAPSDPFAGLYSGVTEPARPQSWDSPPPTVPDDRQLNGSPASAGPAAEPHDDLVSRLERLAALRDSGALTHDEFGIAKQRLLSS